MADAIAAYESEHGVITEDELLAQERIDQKAALVVRGRPGAGLKPRGRRHKAA